MNLKGISFIVIGKNEGWKITKCLKSVFLTIKENNLKEYEILYIDSCSKDDTIERSKCFDEVKVYKLIGSTNAAIARNAGAELSKYKTLFFIDGDMELMPNVLGKVYNEQKGLFYDFISADFEDYYYSLSGNLLEKRKHHNLDKDTFMITTGGLFLIKSELWKQVGGMRNIFKKSQDLDLGLRLAKLNFRLLRVKDVLAKHHTVSYNREDRLWADIFNGNFLYTKPLLYRKNLLNKYVYKLMIREVSMFLLLLLFALALMTKNFSFLLIYPLVVFVKMLYKRKKIEGKNYSLYFRYIIFDVGTLIGFFLFWPNSNNKIAYERIK